MKRLFQFAFLLFLSSSVWGTDYYISPSGSDSNDGLTAGTPVKTFAKAFGVRANDTPCTVTQVGLMSAGDTLILLDGTYSSAQGTGIISFTGTGASQPPSGTVGGRTVVKAQNNGSVTVQGQLYLGRSVCEYSYVEIGPGIHFEGGPDQGNGRAGTMFNTDYNYIHNSSFHDISETAGSVFAVDSAHNNLIEDVWIWGQNRIIALNYKANFNVWRRIVVRGDGCDAAGCTGSGNPNVGITMYSSQNSYFMNVIVVDRILGGGRFYADFASAQHSPDPKQGPNFWLGNISFDTEDHGFSLGQDQGCQLDTPGCIPITAQNNISVDAIGNGFDFGTEPDLLAENLTAINGCPVTATLGCNTNIRVGPSTTAGTLRNLISYLTAGSFGAISSPSTARPSYSDANSPSTYGQSACQVGCLTTNPTSDGPPHSLKYPVRIESGSALKGTGFGGADYGANVVNRYGVTGAFYGDTNYNTLSGTALWPWPNQAQIKTEMCTNPGLGTPSSPVTETRGFCSATTLTFYIHDYFGNGSFIGPQFTAGPTAGSITETSAIITATTDIAGTSVVDYGLTESYGSQETGGSATSHSVTLSGLTADTLYHFRMCVTDADLNETCSSDDTFTTSAASGTFIFLSSGNNQTGATGEALASQLCVIARNAGGTPLADETVDWAVTAGGGSITPAQNTTNGSGIACATATLGSTVGTNTFTGGITGATGTPITFTATGFHYLVSWLTGTGQSQPVSTLLTKPFGGIVRDINASPVASLAVTLTVQGGGGSVSRSSATTDSNGLFWVTGTLGGGAGTNTYRAAVVGTTADITATAVAAAGAAANIEIWWGNNQSHAVGSNFEKPLVVRVTDADDKPAVATVDFVVASGSATLSRLSCTTNAAEGTCGVSLEPTGAGAITVTATSAGLTGSPLMFNETGE